MSNPWRDDVDLRDRPDAPAGPALDLARRAAEALALLGVVVIVVEALAARGPGLGWPIVAVAAACALPGMLVAGVLAHEAALRGHRFRSPAESAAAAAIAVLVAAGPAALAVWFSDATADRERISVPFGVFLTLVGPLTAVTGAGLGLAAARFER